MNKLVLATGNQKKVKELAAMLADMKIQVIPQSEFAVSDADETGTTSSRMPSSRPATPPVLPVCPPWPMTPVWKSICAGRPAFTPPALPVWVPVTRPTSRSCSASCKVPRVPEERPLLVCAGLYAPR